MFFIWFNIKLLFVIVFVVSKFTANGTGISAVAEFRVTSA